MARYLILQTPIPGSPAVLENRVALTPETARSGTEVLQAWVAANPPLVDQRLYAIDVTGATVYDVLVGMATPPFTPRPVTPQEAVASLPAFDPE